MGQLTYTAARCLCTHTCTDTCASISQVLQNQTSNQSGNTELRTPALSFYLSVTSFPEASPSRGHVFHQINSSLEEENKLRVSNTWSFSHSLVLISWVLGISKSLPPMGLQSVSLKFFDLFQKCSVQGCLVLLNYFYVLDSSVTLLYSSYKFSLTEQNSILDQLSTSLSSQHHGGYVHSAQTVPNKYSLNKKYTPLQ